MTTEAPPQHVGLLSARLRLVVASALMLFVQLALIRWAGANLVHLSYFSNLILLASFLGIGLGFLPQGAILVAADQRLIRLECLQQIGLLFLCGGLASLAAMRLGGIWIDRGQALTVILLSSGGLALTTLLGFAAPIGLSIYLVFVLFMAASAVRTNSSMTIAAAIPPPHQRAAFMAFQGTVSNVAAGLGSLFSALYLSTGADNQLQGFNQLSGFYVVVGILTGVGMWLLQRGIRRRDAASHTAGIKTQAG